MSYHWLPTAPLAFRHRGAGGGAVDNQHPQGSTYPRPKSVQSTGATSAFEGCDQFWIDSSEYDSQTLMNMKSGPQTASEFMAKLNADSKYQSLIAEQDRVSAEKTAKLRAAAKPLDDALRSVCPLVTDSVWDLVNTRERYDEALPILAEHLTKDYPDEVLEGIARALAVPQALPYRQLLISLFRRAPPVTEGFRFGLGVAIAHTTGPFNLSETIALAKDRSLGACRMALLAPIKRSRKPEIRQVIDELSKDPDLAKEIASWKRRK